MPCPYRKSCPGSWKPDIGTQISVLFLKFKWWKYVVVTPLRQSHVVFLAWTQFVLSRIFHLRSSNPPASWLGSKAAFLSTVIINMCYAALTIDKLVFSYFKMSGCVHLEHSAAGQIIEGFTRIQRKR